jgi:hypothetical protein
VHFRFVGDPSVVLTCCKTKKTKRSISLSVWRVSTTPEIFNRSISQKVDFLFLWGPAVGPGSSGVAGGGFVFLLVFFSLSSRPLISSLSYLSQKGEMLLIPRQSSRLITSKPKSSQSIYFQNVLEGAH